MDLIALKERVPPLQWPGLERAYDVVAKGDGKELERSLAVVATLVELGLDTTSLQAALLYELPAENASIERIGELLGEEVARLVGTLRRLSSFSLIAPREEQAESLRKMLLAMAEDIRVVYIKLADCLQEMRGLVSLSGEEASSRAREALELYGPLAHRLGVWRVKSELEDLALAFLEPEKYTQVMGLLAEKQTQREGRVDEAIRQLGEELKKAGIKAELSGRLKNIYGTYRKLEKYAKLGRGFDQIHDLVAVRVIVNEVEECYSALGAVHSLWHPLPGEFNDYIANPKENGYRSLHTTALFQGMPLEIQIRTWEMHRVAEFGLAAHWYYKKGKMVTSPDRISWFRQVLEWHQGLKGAEFVEAIKTDLFPDTVFVFTPKGEIKELPAGATPLDFAYRIHTELGNRCIGAKINSKLTALNASLKNGDTVEILASKARKGPSRDWLNSELGYINTSHAREKVRQWFKRQEREENVDKGREVLEKEFRRLGLAKPNFDKLAHTFNYKDEAELLLSISYGEVSAHQIALGQASQELSPFPTPPQPTKTVPEGIRVSGVGNLLFHLAQCCRPISGEPIIGYITRSRGVTIHRQDCYNILREEERERLVPAEWGAVVSVYPTEVVVRAWDRVGLLRDITTLVAEEKVNIASVQSQDNGDDSHTIRLILEARDMAQLWRILTRLEGIKGVITAMRSTS